MKVGQFFNWVRDGMFNVMHAYVLYRETSVVLVHDEKADKVLNARCRSPAIRDSARSNRMQGRMNETSAERFIDRQERKTQPDRGK